MYPRKTADTTWFCFFGKEISVRQEGCELSLFYFAKDIIRHANAKSKPIYVKLCKYSHKFNIILL